MDRSSGILLPIFSLPSNYGIGTLGKEAYKFVDFLKKAGQSYWQILPLGPLAYGDSPYSTYSIYAGNPYFIDLDILVKDNFIKKSDLKITLSNKITYINYNKIKKTRSIILYKAYQNGFKKYKKSYDEFVRKNRYWINDYALYMSLKEYFDGLPFNMWPDNKIKRRDKGAIKKYSKLLEDRINYYKFCQYLFYKQFFKLKKYMNRKGIKLIGDIPIYVPLDSSDVWVNPKCFKLTSAFVPKYISGCPPDVFSRNGQLWGNPIYNYDYMKKDNYSWWINRIKYSSLIYDVIRIDHFRGFESFWQVPYGKKTARQGKWVKGPGMDLLGIIKNKFKNVEFIAEDLGFTTARVIKLVKDFGFPGMKVLQFAFDAKDGADHTPYFYSDNMVCYTGTHDNSTIRGYFKASKRRDINECKRYFGVKNDSEFTYKVICGGMESNAKLFVAQMQDYLDLDNKARINVPGTVGTNWKWRMKRGVLSNSLALDIKRMATLYGRTKDSKKIKLYKEKK